MPKQVAGQSTGVGALIAMDIPDVGELAEVENNAALTGANTLSLSTVGNHTTTVAALAGAAGGTATAGCSPWPFRAGTPRPRLRAGRHSTSPRA